MKIEEIVKAVNGKLLSGEESTVVTGFQQDSRKIEIGDLYVPIIGERFDGHDFIEQALEMGAVATFSSKKITVSGKAVILVEDTLTALQELAKHVRNTRGVKVVGITGSVGKTSTKDMIYSVVKQKYKTLKTLGNYNNDIGLPLTILRHVDEEVMILEMGMNHLREIALLSDIAKPDIAVITNVGTAHIGELGSRENILKAKLEIIEGMDSGILIINKDNDMLQNISIENNKIITVGTKDSEYTATNIVLHEEHSTFAIVIDNTRYFVNVPVQGKHFVINALLALAVGRELDISSEACIEGIETFTLTKNRMDVISLANHIRVIDGTYNASEDSMKSSIDVLSNYQGRKICIFGDMLEMGSYAEELHRSVGAYVASKQVDILLCVGEDAKYIQEAAKHGGLTNTMLFTNNQEVNTYLDTFLQPNDVVLVKGSNGMRLKEIVDYMKEKMS